MSEDTFTLPDTADGYSEHETRVVQAKLAGRPHRTLIIQADGDILTGNGTVPPTPFAGSGTVDPEDLAAAVDTALEALVLEPYGGAALDVTLLDAAVTFTGLTTAVTELDATTAHRHRKWIDLTDYTEWRMACDCIVASAAARFAVAYTTDDGVTWRYLSNGAELAGGDSPPAGNVIGLTSATANPRETALANTTLVAGARGRVLLAGFAWMTTGTASPVVAGVNLQFFR